MVKEIFTISDISKTAGDKDKIHLSGHLKINWTHEIFSGHFPGNPVLPGVVQVQMINKFLNQFFETNLILKRASNIKYPNMVVPKICDTLTINVQIELLKTYEYKIAARLNYDNLTFLKLNGHFVSDDYFYNHTNSDI